MSTINAHPARRMTAKKRLILHFLSDYDADCDHGFPPYSAATISGTLGLDLSNITKTLRVLVEEGLIVREVRLVPAWNARAGDTYDRMTPVYWNASTIAADRAASDREAQRRKEYAAGFAAFVQAEMDRVKRGEKPRGLLEALEAADSVNARVSKSAEP